MNSGRGIRPHVSTPAFSSHQFRKRSLTPRPSGWLVSAFGDPVFIGLPLANALRERTGNDSSVLIPVFSSALLLWEGTAPVALPHHHVWFLSKCLLRKKPRVWPGLILGFQGNSPSADSRRVVARTFAPHLAGQKVKLALAQRFLGGESKTNLLESHLPRQEMREEIAAVDLCVSTVIPLPPQRGSYHSWPRASLSSALHLDLRIQPWLGHLILPLCTSGLCNPHCGPRMLTSSSDPHFCKTSNSNSHHPKIPGKLCPVTGMW